MSSPDEPACWYWTAPPVLEAAFGEVLRFVAFHDGRCAVCDEQSLSQALVADHDHASGLVRGYLCLSCNGREWRGGTPLFINYQRCNPASILGYKETYESSGISQGLIRIEYRARGGRRKIASVRPVPAEPTAPPAHVLPPQLDDETRRAAFLAVMDALSAPALQGEIEQFHRIAKMVAKFPRLRAASVDDLSTDHLSDILDVVASHFCAHGDQQTYPGMAEILAGALPLLESRWLSEYRIRQVPQPGVRTRNDDFRDFPASPAYPNVTAGLL